MDDVVRLSSAQAREVDRCAIEELGLPGIVLMENAGRGAAEVVLDLLRERALAGPVGVVCGPGNNGGDGFVLARHLEIAGVASCVVATSEASRGDAGLARAVLERSGTPLWLFREPLDGPVRSALERCTLVVDALLGTGAHGEPKEPIAGAIELVNELGASRPVVALDLPSGIDADTGAVSSRSVRADVTVTFAAEKLGFLGAAARARAGRLVVASIGVPPVWIARAAFRVPCAPPGSDLR